MINNYLLSFHNNTITNGLGECSFLTKKETMLFLVLIKRKSVEVPKVDIINFVWGDVENYDDNLIQLIHRLRIKLKSVFFDDFISNVRGFGYVFDKNNIIQVNEGSKNNCSLIFREKVETKDIKPTGYWRCYLKQETKIYYGLFSWGFFNCW